MSGYSNSPYLLDEPSTSTEKALLSRAFSHWCGLHHGFSEEEIASAFAGEANVDSATRSEVPNAARLIGELIAAGNLRTFARPFGGGSPKRLPTTDWELDDFRPCSARNALDPKAPFDHGSDPTH